ncbi:MAG: SDR family NAD(P)-dependent oxidoreductase, partial [Chloroflexota bacterium]|nr:SDR family NAD(P)-dependent oxidoreductase [Chloroflexota bacterium]
MGMGHFSGQVAVVTGASAGVGRATALALAAEGATVGLIARRAGPLEAVAEEIARAGGG